MPCMLTVIGITSVGFGRCGKIGVPTVYANIYNYLDWIESIVWPEEVCSPENYY